MIKNEDDDGWTLEITKAGMLEPAPISPWAMGRDKKKPKPFNGPALLRLKAPAEAPTPRPARSPQAGRGTPGPAWR